MERKQTGFTLIELLVVVLIIGILAAVAVPQYQKAVEKSRAAQALTLVKSVVQAAENYYLANGTDFTSFDELAVDIPWNPGDHVIHGAQDTRRNRDWALEVVWSGVQGRYGIMCTRLEGPYAGAGFTAVSSNGSSPLSVSCFERNYSDKTFSSPAGSFCANLMKGTLKKEDSWNRSYTLPF